MKRYQLDPKNLRQLSKTDLARIDRMTDEDIDYSDIPPLGDEFFTKEATITNMKKTYPFESDPISLVVASALKELSPESSPDEDEATEYGRLSPEHEPTGEDELYAIIFDLVEQDCLTDNDDLDSWAISTYERAIIALDEAGFVEIDRTRDRIYAKILPKAHNFLKWMEFHHRRDRIRQARYHLADKPGATVKELASRYKITEAEITGEQDNKK